MDNQFYKKSASKITALSLILSFACAIIIIIAGTYYYYNRALQSLAETASVAALQTAGFVDSYLLEIVINDDCDSGWEYLQAMFDMILAASRDIVFLYIMVPYDDERFMYIVSGNHPEARRFVEEPDIYGPSAWLALSTGEVTATTTPADAGEWGILIAAYAPLRNPQGEVIAVLGADVDMSVVFSQVIEFAIVLGILCLVLQFITNIAMRGFVLSILKNYTIKLMEAEHHRNLSVKKSESKTRFLAKMSHEIRTPLNVISGLTELQLQKDSFSNEVRESFLQISRSSKLLLDLINDIMDYSKVELGKMEIVEAPYDLYGIIVTTLQLNIIYKGEKHIIFEVHMPDDQYTELVGDSLRIRQVLNNILSNAFKYTKEGSVIFSICYEELQGSDDIILVFSVKDTGLGMSQEQLGQLHNDEYVRFVTESSEHIEGTGLGMSITYQLVALMGGSLEAESELGVGTVFTFKIRQKKQSNARLGIFRSKKLKVLDYITDNLEAVSQVDYQNMSNTNILVVDDIQSNLVVIKEMLSMYGINVDTAYCGADAIGLVERRDNYDIIFMDYMMPGMNGIEVTQKIREMGYKKPIVMLTADITNDNDQLFIDNGFDDFLSKPVDIHELDSCLKRFITDVRVIKSGGKQYSEHLISSFQRDAIKVTKHLSELLQDEAFDDKKFDDFRISVHGLKSACSNVGLRELSALAHRLELACNAKNSRILITHSPILLTKIKDAIDKFSLGSTALSDVFLPNIDVEYFKIMLLQLAEECEAYSTDKVKKTLKQMASKEATAEIKDFLTEARQLLLHSDYEVISEKARDFAGRL